MVQEGILTARTSISSSLQSRDQCQPCLMEVELILSKLTIELPQKLKELVEED